MKIFLILLLMMGSANAQTYNPPAPIPPVVYGNPTIATGSAAGSGATATIAGNNVAGTIVVTSGTSTLSGATLVTITFGGSDAHSSCSLTPANTNAVGQSAMIYGIQPVGMIWSIGVGGAPVQANFTYMWSYLCT